MTKTLTAVEQMEAFRLQTESIRDTYAVALEKAEIEVAELTEAIADGESGVQEMYKHYVLDIVSLDAYQSEKKVLDDKKSILHVAQKKIADIDSLMKGELSTVHNEASKLQIDGFRKEENKLIAKKRKEMLKAKYVYLQAVREASKEVLAVGMHDVWMSQLAVELGQKSYSYATNVHPDKFLSNSYSSALSADISVDEFNNAYVGKIDSRLNNESE